MTTILTTLKERVRLVACLTIALLGSFSAMAQSPQAGFTVSDNSLYLCSGTTAQVQFTNTSTNVPLGATYFWNFGNGTPGSNLANPVQVYTQAGLFTVTLQILQNGNVVSTATQNITVAQPVSAFTVNMSTGCEDQTVFQFSNQPLNADSFVWNFGDGVLLPNVNNPSHVYNFPNPNTSVSLLLYVDGFQNACASSTVPLNVLPVPQAIPAASSNIVCDPNENINFTNSSLNTTSHFWNFGDGTTSTLGNPSHIFGSYGAKNITYIATGPGGCADTTILTIYISNAVVPTLTASVDSACSPMVVTFTTNVNNAGQYVWDFGDGTAPVTTLTNTVQHTFVNPTTSPVGYDVSVTTIYSVNSSCNSSVTMNDLVTAMPPPVPSFTVSPTGCVFTPIQVTNTTPNAVSFYWTFGNSIASTLENPVTEYNNSGNYTIRLIATDIYGCKDTTTVINAIQIANTNASFNATNTSGCSVNAQFINYSTWASAFFWDFGDGTTSTEVSPTHYYGIAGNYDVTLVATYGECADTLVMEDFINVTYVTPNYTPPSTPFNGCVGIASSFTANNPNGTGYLWDFGDGNTGTGPNPTHVYSAPGTYIVSLVTQTADSCQEFIENFATVEVYGGEPDLTTVNRSCSAPYSVDFSTPANGISYQWNFGDGSPYGTGQNVNHVYTEDGYYNISLTIVTPSGCLSTYNGFNQLALFPFEAGTGSECVGLNMNGLVETNFRPIPEDVVSVQWTFSDGQTSNEFFPTMFFDTTNANITSTAIITNAFGCVDTVTAEVCADAPPAIPQPVGWDVAPDTDDPNSDLYTITACAPYQLTFNNQFLYADSVIWHFGDGATSNLTSPTHEYGAAGTYIVYAEVWYDNYNTYDTVYQPYVYEIGGHIPTISLSQENFCDSIRVFFQGFSPDAVSWLWTLGNNDTETTQSFYYTYDSNEQTYHVQLTTVDSDGCPGSATSSVYSPTAAPQFNYSSLLCNSPLNIAHNLDTTFGYTWTLGDGTVTNDVYPNHLYAGPGTYGLKLNLTDALGCPHEYILDSVKVYQPTAHYTASAYSGCNPLTVTLTSQSANYSPGNTHYWFFGNQAAVANDGSPINFTFTAPGHFPVKLQVFNVNGQNCSGTFIDTIHVYQAESGLTFTQSKGCFQPDIAVQYTDNSVNAVDWKWNFGDGTTSTEQNPSHTFTTMPTDSVMLTITDINGCKDSVKVENIQLFSAGFSLDTTIFCGSSQLPFVIVADSGSVYSTVWNFGDNSPEVSGNAVYHSFDLQGLYDVTAIVTSPDGCADTIVQQVTIEQPVPMFSSNSPVTCAPSNVVFTNNSIAPPGSTFIWNFGDGTIITNNNPIVAQTYLNPGIYDVTLSIVTPMGCTADTVYTDYVTVLGPVANFIVSTTNGCENVPVQFINLSTNVSSFVWYFGDGVKDSTNYFTEHSFPYSGIYQSTLVVFDSVGCASSMTLQSPIIINQMPEAIMTVDFESGCAPYLPQFYNTSNNATTYTWTFGNGDFSFDSIPSYTYVNPGVYNITMIAGNGTGCQDTAFASVIVNTPPVANFIAAVIDSTCEGIIVGFTNTSVSDSLVNYKWTISDGFNTDSIVPPNYMFDSSGVFTIELTVFNTLTGCMDVYSQNVTISVPGLPMGSLTTADTIGCGQVTANFDFQIQGATSFVVDYGDGVITPAFNPQHTYSQPGTYYPVIYAYNDFGCVDTIGSAAIRVIPNPVAAFSADTTGGCIGLVVNFTNQSSNLMDAVYSWNFGNGQTSTDSVPPTISYANSGAYNVSLTVTNFYGCAHTLVESSYIIVADTIAPAQVAMRRVTVVSETQVKVEWEPSTAFDFGSYTVYRFDGATYQPIATITNQAQTGYTDNAGLATLTNTYCYKVGVTDYCGFTKGIDSVGSHCTVDVTALLLQNNDRLIKWVPYDGCAVDYYEVYRTTGNAWNDTTAANLIGTVPGTSSAYLDSDLLCPRQYKYRIKAISLCGGTQYSMSDTAAAPLPKVDFTTLPANVMRSTVVDNQFVRTEWKAPYTPELISYYTIYRSADSISYQSVGQINGPFSVADTLLSYDDWDASIQSKKYYYKIETTSQCSDKSYTGATGDNIVLNATINPAAYEVTLDWTPYVSWGPMGVDYYVLEWQDEAGNWHVLELPQNQYPDNKVPGNKTDYSAPY